jgi:hypothetical protein
VSVELVGAVPILILVTVLLIEGFLAASAVDRVAQAARDGARVASRGGDGVAAARTVLPGWVTVRELRTGPEAAPGCAGVCATVVVDVPIGVPGWATLAQVRVQRSADFPAGG